jgi:hypothetical protein
MIDSWHSMGFKGRSLSALLALVCLKYRYILDINLTHIDQDGNHCPIMRHDSASAMHKAGARPGSRPLQSPHRCAPTPCCPLPPSAALCCLVSAVVIGVPTCCPHVRVGRRAAALRPSWHAEVPDTLSGDTEVVNSTVCNADLLRCCCFVVAACRRRCVCGSTPPARS